MKTRETAYFAGGCFWCITPVFRQMDGVEMVVSGYCGGSEIAPTYEDVKHQRTGHRETVQIDYDPARVTYARLLEVFLSSVDPFDAGGQFIDRGHSYTLAVYYCDDAQQKAAAAAIARLQAASQSPVCIAIEPFRAFYSAEEEHQDYYRKNPEAFEEELIASGRKRLN